MSPDAHKRWRELTGGGTPLGVIGAFDPGDSHGIAVIWGTCLFLHAGRLKGKGREGKLTDLPFWPWAPVREWIVEMPAAPGPGRSRASGISLGITAGAFIGQVGPSQLTLVKPQSWNWRGRGKAAAESWLREIPRWSEHAKAMEGEAGWDDVLAAIGMLVWRFSKSDRLLPLIEVVHG